MLIVDHPVTDDQGDRLRREAREPVTGAPEVVPDVALGLRRLCQAATDELDLVGVSVTLITEAGTYALVAATGPRDRHLETIQFDVGEGPALEAFRNRRPVLVPDLRLAQGRWPGFTGLALADRVLSVFCFPLQLGAARFGVLTFADERPRSLTSQEVSACLIFTEVATELMLDSSPTGTHPDPDLRDATHARDEVYQAQGMLTVDLGVSLAEALAVMRATAFGDGIPLSELAADVVSGRRQISPAELPPAHPRDAHPDDAHPSDPLPRAWDDDSSESDGPP